MKQSMRKKIQSSMILVITLTMLIAYGITTLVVYRQTIRIMEGPKESFSDNRKLGRRYSIRSRNH